MSIRSACGSGLIWLVLLLAALSQRPASAHDIWLHAENFSPAEGDVLIVRQLLGAELDTDLARPESTQELGLLWDITPRFTLITRQGSVDLLAELRQAGVRSEVKPVLERSVDFDGLGLVAMEHALIYTDFSNEEYLEYLEHEELDRPELREGMGSRKVQTEAYRRTLKTLVHVGQASESETTTDLHRRVLGLPIEIVLLADPYRLDPGDALDVRVLFAGQPLAGQTVKAYNSDGKGPVGVHRARTDAEGFARFDLDRAGLWLIRLVHLTPCAGGSEVDCEDADWESYWTAYSFALD